MSAIEEAVEKLAASLDSLESRLDDSRADAAECRDALDLAKRQARIAKAQSERAAGEVGETVADLKAILEDLRARSATGADKGDPDQSSPATDDEEAVNG